MCAPLAMTGLLPMLGAGAAVQKVVQPTMRHNGLSGVADEVFGKKEQKKDAPTQNPLAVAPDAPKRATPAGRKVGSTFTNAPETGLQIV